MPLFFVGRRLLHLAAGRPIRIKHHLSVNACGPLGGSTSAEWPQSLKHDQQPVLSDGVVVPGAAAVPCTAPWPRPWRTCSTTAGPLVEDNQGTSEGPEEMRHPPRGTDGRECNAAPQASEGRQDTSQGGLPGSSQAEGKRVRSPKPQDVPFRSAASSNPNLLRSRQTDCRNQRRESAEGPGHTWAMVEKAMRSAQRGPRPERSRPSDPQLLALWDVVRSGDKEAARQGLRRLLEERGRMTIRDFNYLLKACAAGGQDTELGLYVYATMTEHGVTPDAKSVAWMLRLFVRARQSDEALPWLAQARASLRSLEDREAGVLRSPAYFLNVLLGECITRRDWATAGRYADELGHYGMDGQTYLLLLQIAGLEQQPQTVALTWAALQEARGVPTPEQRSVYIQALARCGQLDDAVRELWRWGGTIQGAQDDRRGSEEDDGWESGQQRGQGGAGSSQDPAIDVDDGAGPLPVELGPEEVGARGVDGGDEGGEARHRGLWWEAPPPRSTSKSTLAHLRVAYNAVIAAASRAKDVERAKDLFAEMRRADLQPDRYTYNALLRAVATTRNLEDTQRVAGGIRPDEHTVATLVDAHAGAGQLEQAAQLLEGATATTTEAPFYTVAYNTLLDAWANQGDPERAMKMFQQMRAHHVAPDACTYRALFQAFHRSRLAASHGDTGAGESEERAVQEQLLRLEGDMRASGVRHTPQTLTALVAALGPASLGLLLERVAHARQAGPDSAAAAPLDAAFFAVAIGVCATAKQLDPAGALWADMLALGVRPDVAAYNAAINCCAEMRELQRGLRLADEALRAGLHVDGATLNIVIKLCCFCGQYRAALPLLFRAEAAGAHSDVVGYNLLLRAAAIARDTATLEQLLERMKRRGVAPDGDTCLTTVTSYVSEGCPDHAAEALDALTARMFGHGDATVEPHGGLVPEAAEASAQTGEAVPHVRDQREEGLSSRVSNGEEGRSRLWGPHEAVQRGLHVGRTVAPEEDWEFVADNVVPEGREAEEEDAATAEVTRAAMLYPSAEARNEFLARMVAVSGGGFEGAPPAWEQRAVALREIDWNGWARRLREQYDARKAGRLRPKEVSRGMPP
ncbi:putative Pentatricopeptide repeat domain containing protein [Klebsormidium nitens]|uniref:Putative Pentatricopeptide repeat domain containing protein n=1 Tax=Klebsormidium nitens TaxID=105231 RepID=A0A1Y1II13_KLENI|nr:putative Pentatricopeptide repeat domain containing protein [Klebsormidium nitens]|eukprot:GAQ90520.1 putative Pentatricopeptide repeat domain containing protein [Klebsormidium nitens]